jgi:hypothetical protein
MDQEKTKKIGLSERTALESSKILLERFGQILSIGQMNL